MENWKYKDMETFVREKKSLDVSYLIIFFT